MPEGGAPQRLFYFAFGSNLLSVRLLERVGDCERLGAARLPGYELTFRKRGRDGTGKCDVSLRAGAEAEVWGALYAMTPEQKVILDRIEGPGYSVESVRVQAQDRPPFEAFTYCARPDALADGLAPFDWYLDFVLHGAREQALPAVYIDGIEAVAALEDPDAERRALNRAVLQRGLEMVRIGA